MNKIAEENIKITSDFVIEVFNKTKSAETESEKKTIATMVALLSEHIGEDLSAA